MSESSFHLLSVPSAVKDVLPLNEESVARVLYVFVLVFLVCLCWVLSCKLVEVLGDALGGARDWLRGDAKEGMSEDSVQSGPRLRHSAMRSDRDQAIGVHTGSYLPAAMLPKDEQFAGFPEAPAYHKTPTELAKYQKSNAAEKHAEEGMAPDRLDESDLQSELY